MGTNASWAIEYMNKNPKIKELLNCLCTCPLGLVFGPGKEICKNLGFANDHYYHSSSSSGSTGAGFNYYGGSSGASGFYGTGPSSSSDLAGACIGNAIHRCPEVTSVLEISPHYGYMLAGLDYAI